MKLRKGNKIKYGQDSQQRIGVPHGVDYKVEHFGKKNFKLTGYGYGKIGNYGNGALYVWGLTNIQRKRFENAVDLEKT